ncbi:hypothetical protein HU761_15660 [Pseudomonas sp. SWRI59]|uniref:hypothetical protein n=1 Tax=Pseudomonas TaxID=286 RepID=UPI001645B418|nr:MULTISPECIES: hypothetical protein [unclassified Pseudomonas]MBC3482924.1 hypothetical protein [Pseudomonas sp. SWRI77]MBC3502847.1 hypothetical protein [Pseudomonas sp. SWRI59]MBC3507605.1 hypothetical protein [Pseudomonas sp. SWRI68]UVL05646.1 hypothetical protein LOY26_08965 [Pseudomonas sp. B21-047]
MRAILPMAAVLMLVGCASATMETARGGKPTAQLDSHKAPALVAQCIQFSWQEEAVFGVDASGYLEPRKQGGFTVYTRDAEAFVDIYPQADGTRVDYYAQNNDSVALQRRAAAATCL